MLFGKLTRTVTLTCMRIILFCVLLSATTLLPATAPSAIAGDAAIASQQLNILTSFPPGFYTPFLENFSVLYPDIQISILNKKTTSAIGEILHGNKRNFDLFWSSSADAFDVLQSAHLLVPSKQEHDYPLVSIENLPLNDPDGYVHGFALSGVGWMWNSRYLDKEGLPVPENWRDLTKPVYYGHIAMSTPSRSGTTHLIVENFLQQLGWKQGWAQLLLMSGNFATVTARSFSVPEGVGSGRFGIGLVIDFLARPDNNRTIHFCYGKPVFLVPAEIARLKNDQNPQAADLFLHFILSTRGQKILLQPEINRIPISQQLLPDSPRKVARLLETGAQSKLRSYNVHLSRRRYQLVNLLFDRMITFRLRERRQLWKQLLDLTARYGADNHTVSELKRKVVAHLTRVPVSAEQSQTGELLDILAPPTTDTQINPQQRRLINSWDTFIDKEFELAKNELISAEKILHREGK